MNHIGIYHKAHLPETGDNWALWSAMGTSPATLLAPLLLSAAADLRTIGDSVLDGFLPLLLAAALQLLS